MKVAAIEEPVLSTDHDLPERPLAARVVERDAPIEEDAAQLLLLVRGVSERLGREVATQRRACSPLYPFKERIDERDDRHVALALAVHRRKVRERVVRSVHGSNSGESLYADGVL